MTGPKLSAYVSDDFEETKILEESFQKSIFIIKILSRKKNQVFFMSGGLSPPAPAAGTEPLWADSPNCTLWDLLS